MKKENPIEILNEILLRMKYDPSKTLTENINEQSSYTAGYTPFFGADVRQGGPNDPYEYKKEAGEYYTRKKGTTNWTKTTGSVANSIATKIYGDKAPFQTVKPQTTQTVNPNVYPGPRKTTLSSYSSGTAGEDSDLVNSSEFPQYKMIESDKQRQIASSNWFNTKNEAYRKVQDAIKNGYDTTLQKAWNDFVYAYKHLYRDQEQWDDYRTLIKQINNSKKFQIKNGKISYVPKTQPAPITLPKSIVDYEKQWKKKVESMKFMPRPVKPTEPEQGSYGKLPCPDIIYDPLKRPVPPWIFNGKCYKFKTEADKEYDKALTEYETNFEAWKEANPKADFKAIREKLLKNSSSGDESKALDDIKYGRDVTASYRDEYERKAQAGIYAQQISQLGLKLEEKPSALWEVFLEVRNLWSQVGTQVLATGVALSIETAGGSLIASFLLEIGIDIFIFVVDLIDCFMNPDSTESWNRLEEDITTFVLFGAFGLLARGLKSLSDINIQKEVKLADGTIVKPAKTLRTVVGNGWNTIKESVKKVIDDFINEISKTLPSKWVTEIKNFLNRIYDSIDNFFKTLPKITRTFLSYGLPYATALFVILEMNKSTIKDVLGPLVEDVIGITIPRLQELAGFEDVPTDEEIKYLSTIVVPDNFQSEIEKAQSDSLREKAVETTGEKIEVMADGIRKKVNELSETEGGSQTYLDTMVIPNMKGPCKDYFTTLRNKNKITCILIKKDVSGKGGEAVVDAYTINGVKGYKLKYVDPYTDTGVKDSTGTEIDCEGLNKKELNKKD